MTTKKEESKPSYKVTKVMSWRSRKVNLGNYDSAELDAGIEIMFDESVAIDSETVKQAFSDMRKTIHNEMSEQWKLLRERMKAAKKLQD